MLIGKSFNRRCEKILCSAALLSGYEEGKNISVVDLSDELKLDRVEIRNLFQYLIDLDFIRAESIGGPYLYGHISLTKKGLLKVKRLLGD
ncbi:hypothetical protein DYD21_07920 [Rhodohalobacter sp. SW132]|uniref:hypothetical protein n=1 Tax=Rhodohalobacter sp. SW132 TaxID=2293433 RepID=UPI000E25A3BD|nr:hypothetical protein [Rhodohalobacter sp. SW132]REL37700.1 hypothetical protein DYD21_07920 [Rhodohalobacter sp. SW132]